MSSVCTLRLKRRSAFSRGSPSCTRTSAKKNTPPNSPNRDNFRIRHIESELHKFEANLTQRNDESQPSLNERTLGVKSTPYDSSLSGNNSSRSNKLLHRSV